MSKSRKAGFGRFLLILFAMASILVTVAFAEGEEAVISNKRIGPVSKYLVDRITGIQTKKYPDKYGWVIDVK